MDARPPSVARLRRRHRARRLVRALPFAGLVAATIAVLGPAGAAFVGQTDSGASFVAGTVVLADDDGGVAPFAVAGAQPNDLGERCVRVSYSGNLAASVRFFVPASGGALAPHLRIAVDAGSGTQADCGDFAPTQVVAAETPLATLAGSAADYATGLGTWQPTGAASRTYRIRWAIAATTPPSLLGAGASATLGWEARSQ